MLPAPNSLTGESFGQIIPTMVPNRYLCYWYDDEIYTLL